MTFQIKLPKGYRWVKCGEKLQAGDLFPCVTGQWEPTKASGQPAGFANYYIRRK